MKKEVSTFLTKASDVMSSAKAKLAVTAAGAYIAVSNAMTTIQVYAGNVGGAGGARGTSDSIAKGIMNALVKVFPVVGGFFILSGVFKYLMAFRSDNPEGQATAVKDIVIGAVFVVFDIGLWAVISQLF